MKDTIPRVSIIVPNYNHARFLEERMNSIVHQTYQDFEIILLDDASTDDSITILEKYKADKRVSHVIINTQNSGSPFKQWQKGIALAKGKYIWIAEADDSAVPGFLENLVPLLDSDDGMVLAFSDSQRFGDVTSEVTSKADLNDSNRFSGVDFITHYMTRKNYIPNASAVIFRRNTVTGSILRKISEFRFTGDWCFWNALLTQGNVYYVNAKLNFFRKHSHSVTSSINSDLRNKEIKRARMNAFWLSKYSFPDKIKRSLKLLIHS